MSLMFWLFQGDDVMEMQGNAGADDANNQYGVEAGYTEDYGAAAAKMEPLPVDDQGYGTNANAMVDDANGANAACNPFTQQQYDQNNQKSSNPFKK